MAALSEWEVPDRCEHCGDPLPPQTRKGSVRYYCARPRACRQRAYEARRGLFPGRSRARTAELQAQGSPRRVARAGGEAAA